MESAPISFDKHVVIKDFLFKALPFKQDAAVAICQQQFTLLKTSAEQQIPKLIHFIWIGDNPIPPSFEIYKQPWYSNHPDYQFKFWTEKDLASYEWINKEIILDKSLNPGLRADALRLEILHTHGGIYIDLDMAMVKPLHSLFEQFDTDFFIGVSNTKVFEVNNAIVGCIKGHPFVEILIKELKKGFQKQIEGIEKQRQLMSVMAEYDSSIKDKMGEFSAKGIDVINTSGPGFITRQLFKYDKTQINYEQYFINSQQYILFKHLNGKKDTKILILPIEYFYPLSNQLRDQLTPDNYLSLITEQYAASNSVYGCHMWESNWVAKKQ